MTGKVGGKKQLTRAAKKAAWPRTVRDFGSRRRMKHESVTIDARKRFFLLTHFERFAASVMKEGSCEP